MVLILLLLRVLLQFQLCLRESPRYLRCFPHRRSSIHVCVCFFISSRALAGLDLPASSLRVIGRLPTFTSSSAFPVGSSSIFTLPSSRVPGDPDFPRNASCYPVACPNANTIPAHLYTTGPVYTYATQALGSVGPANYITVFCNTSAGA